jgi:hypothetical protein
MARSDKVKFRREYTVSSGAYLGDSINGFFVGDVLSLHIDLDLPSSSVLIEGRIGTSGPWVFLRKATGEVHIGDVDLTQMEYFRINVVPLTGVPIKVIMFGYDNPVQSGKTLTEKDDRDFDLDIKNQQLLEEIRDSLQSINTHLSFITGEDI